MTFEITMTADGVNAVLAALGKLPTETGVYPLFDDIRRQAAEQAKQQSAED